jgi:hypothetical protein
MNYRLSFELKHSDFPNNFDLDELSSVLRIRETVPGYAVPYDVFQQLQIRNIFFPLNFNTADHKLIRVMMNHHYRHHDHH